MEGQVDLLVALEMLSYIVTLVGFPFTILVYVREQRLARLRDEETVYLALIDEQVRFQRLVLEHADLHLHVAGPARGAARAPAGHLLDPGIALRARLHYQHPFYNRRLVGSGNNRDESYFAFQAAAGTTCSI